MSRVAIIGGGIGGVSLARALSRSNRHEITLFEKGRGLGGRMATRRADPYRFDHGAQCFTIRTTAFRRMLEPLLAEGLVAEWSGPVVNIEGGRIVSQRVWAERHYVAVPGMNALAHRWGEGIDVRTGIEIAPLPAERGDGWTLSDTSGAPVGTYDLVFSTTTPHQTLALLGPHGPRETALNRGAMKPCYALMIGFGDELPLPYIAAKVLDGPIKWVSVNSTKPGRDRTRTSFVAHSRSGWAASRLETDPAHIEVELRAAFATATGLDLAGAEHVTLHRWRSALVRTSLKAGPWWSPQQGLGATGDWSLTSRIEDVVQMAERLAGLVEATNETSA